MSAGGGLRGIVAIIRAVPSIFMLASGTRLGAYEITAFIAAGGMGEVYRARDSRLDRDVAIKVLSPACAADPERIRRFEQEARAAAALNHPHILSIHDIGRHNGSPYIVSEVLEGGTLREITANGSLPDLGLRCEPSRRSHAVHLRRL